VPSHFTSTEDEVECARSAAAIGDLSWMLKVDLKGYGLKGAPAFGAVPFLWRLAPLHMLVTSDPSAREALMASLRSLGEAGSNLSLPPPVYITDVTSAYAQLLLAGPRSRDILRKLTSLNLSDGALPDRSCGQSRVAHVRAIVLRKDLDGTRGYHLLVSREYGESAWESVLHAGKEFNLAPFGLQAQQLLGV
jgi:glycine cleavage system aminomethyltransferase T